MSIPLNFSEISLWLAITAIILLATVEMLSPHYGGINIYIDKKKLKDIGFAVSFLFLATVTLRIVNMILTL